MVLAHWVKENYTGSNFTFNCKTIKLIFLGKNILNMNEFNIGYVERILLSLISLNFVRIEVLEYISDIFTFDSQ